MKPIIRAAAPLVLALTVALPVFAATPPAARTTPRTPPLPAFADLAANEGVARLRCKASVESMLSECSVVAELPAGVGVGEAALKQVAANPHLDGVPAGGGVIEANFRIPLTAEQVAAKPAMNEVVYTQADWARKPSATQLAAAYPARAAEAGIGGSATLSCAVAGTGVVGPCKVVRESPSNQGFGNAALKLAPLFQMRPKKEAGVPVAGTVTIPLRFSPPPPGSPDLNIRCVAQIC